MRLSEIKTGEKAVIVKILGHGAFRKRVIEMGFVKGQEVEVLLNAPLHDPIKYRIMDYEISLRRSEASMIEVLDEIEFKNKLQNNHTNTLEDVDDIKKLASHESKVINIALIGNPNCGKTSMFNIVSGSHEHVGNYSGVTVDAKEGEMEYGDYKFKIVDLPGTYSLSAYSPEELYVRRYLKDAQPDVIVNVVVASNLERNLYLTTELIDMDNSMVIALNMYDELQKADSVLDYEHLGKMIGVPIVPTISKTGKGINKLLDTIIEVYEYRNSIVRHVHVYLGKEIEDGINTIKTELKKDPKLVQQFSPRYLAIKLLEGDKEVDEILQYSENFTSWKNIRDVQVKKIEKSTNDDIVSAIAGEKYGFIAGALKETLVEGDKEETKTTRIIDAFVTNKLFGFPIFILLMWLMFWATFEIGQYPMDWIGSLVSLISDTVRQIMPEGALKDLLIDGVIGGVGGVIVFLPNILILFFCISFMEDSGYMARAAFIMDKIMHKIGLHGKSFIPLIMGFGCNVPAIMATRAIESRSSRLITMLINPFFSCSARLPIYILLVGTFFPEHGSIVFLGLYLLGIAVAVITARLLRRFYFKTDETPFVMELPPYRLPSIKTSLRHMWGKGKQYLQKMGGIILVASIVVWALNYFPLNDGSKSVTEHQEESYLGQIGKFISPVVEPLGFNWKISVALVSGTAAKEIVVSTLGVLYSDGDTTTKKESLSSKLLSSDSNTGSSGITPLMALSFMAFVLLYFPCIASITAIVKESESIWYGVFVMIYNTVVAWIVAFVIYQVGLLFIS